MSSGTASSVRIGSGIRLDMIYGPLTVLSIMLGEATGSIAGLLA